MQTSLAISLRSLRPTTARLVQHRRAAVVPARHLWVAPRAQEADKGAGVPEKAPAEGTAEQRAVAPSRRGMDTVMAPSWGRMSHMLRGMEQEMEAVSRAFGLPSFLPSTSSLFADIPEPPALSTTPALTRSLAVDIMDKGNALEIHADVPGMSKDDIKVQVSPDRVLTISAERKHEVQEGSEEAGNLRIERSYGSMMRRFSLPDNVDAEGIKASEKDGVLKLTVPKSPEAQPKSIDISVASE